MDNNLEQRDTKTKRIAKNTLLLYVRMLFLMCISLLTSRYILQALGAQDYGIYSVVGGFVSMFSLISASLTSACSRFINYELGTGNSKKLQTVFSTAVTIHILLAIIIAILCETLGLWYINNKMVIPSERIYAANFCFQFSVLNFCTSLITVPYNSAIIAHEKMSTFAYVSIFEGVSKMLICFLIIWCPWDHLIFYALLMLLDQLIVRTIYQVYCKKKFAECRSGYMFDKQLILQMFSYSGWHIIGNSAGILKNQGVDMILNLFFGPILNAAKGISNTVLSAVSGFASNFMIALSPQITQSYAKNEYNYTFGLVFSGARLSYYLLFVLSLPLIINTDYILHLWLGTPPEFAVVFSQLALVVAMITSFSNPLMILQNATGKVRNYQLVVGGLQLMNLPFCYIAFKLGGAAIYLFLVSILIEILSLFARLFMIPLTVKSFNAWRFLFDVVLRCLLVSVIAAIIPYFLQTIMPQSFISVALNVLVCVTCSSLVIYFLGLKGEERVLVVNKIRAVLTNFHKK